MSSLIILRHVAVEHANAIAGFTYGFPAITHFLGYTHALSRKLQASHGLTLDACGVVCHNHQVHCHQPGEWGDYVFAQSRNPLTKEGDTAPIMEEGKMHFTATLLIECNGLIPNGETGIAALQRHLGQLCPTMRLAGGSISTIRQVEVVSVPQQSDQCERFNRRELRRLLPGFALLDRTNELEKHYSIMKAENPESELLDAWLDFAALKARAEPILAEGEGLNENTKANWRYIPKPSGWLVPIMTGYRAISPLYPPGTVGNTRDCETPFTFAEAVYGIGEWRSPHRLQSIDQLMWRYQYQEQGGWYLGKNGSQLDNTVEVEEMFDY